MSPKTTTSTSGIPLSPLLWLLLLVLPMTADAEVSALELDVRFGALRLASVALPGTADELVVDEEQALEVFLSPSDFPDALVRFSLTGASADFAMNLDTATMRGEAIPGRVQWPGLGGRSLEVDVPGTNAEMISLISTSPSDFELGDQELSLEWYIRPQESETEGPLRGQVQAVRVSAVGEGAQTLAVWFAPLPPEGCRPQRDEALPTCRASGVSRAIRSISMDPSGRWCAIAGGDLRPRVDVWDVSAFTLRRRISFPPWLGPPLLATFTADGRHLLVVDAAGTAHVWEAATGGGHRRIEADARAAELLDAGRLLAVSDRSGRQILWRVRDGTISTRLGGSSERQCTRLAASGDGSHLATVDVEAGRTEVVVWRIEDQQIVGRIRGIQAGLVDLLLDGPSEHVMVSHDERGLLRASVALNAEWREWGGDGGRRCRGALALSPDHRFVACVQGETVAILDVADGHVVTILENTESDGELSSLVFSPDGELLLATGGGHIMAWEIPRNRRRR